MAGIARFPVLFAAAVLCTTPCAAEASGPASGCRVEILIDGVPVPAYHALGTRYVEALKGRAYQIRLYNPFDVRVAVALSVDGLNTIDARRTTAGEARKWVLDPHETVTISGWQTSMTQARRFYFTSEERSYAQRLGHPENLGVISAVFFKERRPVAVTPLLQRRPGDDLSRQEERAPNAPMASAAPERGAAGAAASKAAPTRDEYAATGIGERTDHEVTLVQLDLEDRPAASVDIRYEYRPQLVKLGVLPDLPLTPDPLARRQHAHGFEGGFCPEIREK